MVRAGTRNRSKKLTPLTVAGYFFLFAVCAKMVYFYESHHPEKEDLLRVQGIVRKIRLGGEGSAAYLHVASDLGTHRYSSYYGKVWPGMELIRVGDRVDVLAEKNKLNPHELVTGKRYYLWELIHNGRLIISYDKVRAMVQAKEATINEYINLWLVVSLAILGAVCVRRMPIRTEQV